MSLAFSKAQSENSPGEVGRKNNFQPFVTSCNHVLQLSFPSNSSRSRSSALVDWFSGSSSAVHRHSLQASMVPLRWRISSSTSPRDIKPNVSPDIISAKITRKHETPAVKCRVGGFTVVRRDKIEWCWLGVVRCMFDDGLAHGGELGVLSP
ncbi:hypothetical protein Fot_11603 [Forsythia ovata]|uniref:Uncharacterized protein n=1 Tax=Forsythia ovata TaxID=205694 RepID=A0ABD1WKT9_9LAMI